MIDYPWNNLIIIFAVIVVLIDKFFFMRNGMLLKINEGFPKILGKRKEDSKWANHLGNAASLAAVIYIIDMFIKFLQHEGDKIQQQLGNLS